VSRNPEEKANMSTDQAIEKEIQAKGLTAARVTPADIEASIGSETYFTAEDGLRGASAGKPGVSLHLEYVTYPGNPLSLLTFCVLTLRNGFTVTGESACASPENFDAEVGRKIARQNAINKVWPLLGYELRSKLVSCDKPDHTATLRRALVRLTGAKTLADIVGIRRCLEGDETIDAEDLEASLEALSALEQTLPE
jgi:hypothetical protein